MQSGVGEIPVDQRELTKYTWCFTVMTGMPSEWIDIIINSNINQLRLILIYESNVTRAWDPEKI